MREVQGEGRLSRNKQLVVYFYNVPHLGVAYYVAKPRLAHMPHQPVNLPRLCASAHISTADTLTLLIKASATVTVYRGLRQTLFFLAEIISLCFVCVGIIRNNSLIG